MSQKLSFPVSQVPSFPEAQNPGIDNRQQMMQELVRPFGQISSRNAEAMMAGLREAMQQAATQAQLEEQRQSMVAALGQALNPIQSSSQQMVHMHREMLGSHNAQAGQHRAALAGLSGGHQAGMRRIGTGRPPTTSPPPRDRLGFKGYIEPVTFVARGILSGQRGPGL